MDWGIEVVDWIVVGGRGEGPWVVILVGFVSFWYGVGWKECDERKKLTLGGGRGVSSRD